MVKFKNHNMHIIFDKSRPQFCIKYINSDGSVTLTNVEAEAMKFQSQQEANAIIESLQGGADFWGKRPTRPHK